MFRRLQLVILAAILVIAAFSTGLTFLFYLVYLGVLVIGGSYVLTRLGLADLEAGYAVNQLSGHVGDRIRVTYTLRNTSRIPKPWLEVHNPTSLPAGLPGRAISLGGNTERSWLIRTPLTRRGHFRIEPLQIRTGDPFGFFESSPVPRCGARSRSRMTQASAVCSRSNSLTWMSPWRAVDFQWIRLNASPGAQGRTVVASGVAWSVRSRIAWLPSRFDAGSRQSGTGSRRG